MAGEAITHCMLKVTNRFFFSFFVCRTSRLSRVQGNNRTSIGTIIGARDGGWGGELTFQRCDEVETFKNLTLLLPHEKRKKMSPRWQREKLS